MPLSSAQTAEAESLEEYEARRPAKEEDIASTRRATVQRNPQSADTSEKHAQAAQEFEDTQAQLALDQEFLAKPRPKCPASGEGFNSRVESRTQGSAAAQDTANIINRDSEEWHGRASRTGAMPPRAEAQRQPLCCAERQRPASRIT